MQRMLEEQGREMEEVQVEFSAASQLLNQKYEVLQAKYD